MPMVPTQWMIIPMPWYPSSVNLQVPQASPIPASNADTQDTFTPNVPTTVAPSVMWMPPVIPNFAALSDIAYNADTSDTLPKPAHHGTLSPMPIGTYPTTR